MTQYKNLIRLAADIGGTFTDVVLETPTGLVTAKVPTDVLNPEQGILNGVNVVLEKASVTPEQVDVFIHGTTLATNALIERKGAKTALITTEGFRDSLEIAYENRFDQYDLMIDKPVQLIPRELRFTVPERMDVRGRVLLELDREAVLSLVNEIETKGIESVAVGLLHSYANPAHEQAVREMLIEAGCKAEISLSSEVCPEVREYERLMTTACNAYVQPIMARYLKALKAALHENGFRSPLFLMTSGGGMTTLESAIRFPIRLVESGPSGGAVLASRIAANVQEKNVVSFDMGGTTAKICLIDDYEPQTARNFEIARAARFQKGSGMPVRIPVVEMIEIGAGGGSIAHVDSMGRLAIGPESAGSTPGPACYGHGGERATVTDANVLLGKIDPQDFAEGKMQLDIAAAEASVTYDIANPLNVPMHEAAFGIGEMVEENMANAARIHSVEHGADLTQCTMIAFGGAGPLHAVRLAEKLNIQRVIVPANSGVGSAVGFLWAPMAYEVVQSRYMTLDYFNASEANHVLSQIGDEAFEIVLSGAPEEELTETRTAYMRYVGQGHEIEIPLPNRDLTSEDNTLIKTTYEEYYSNLYGRTIPERDIEILSWSVVVSSAKKAVEDAAVDSEAYPAMPNSSRKGFLPSTKQYEDVPVYWRPELSPGAYFEGPAMVAEPQTTTFVTSAYRAHIDSQSNLILEEK
nr:hydantoinase/oxoprolinase family protein [uncultured Amphritea sp.]